MTTRQSHKRRGSKFEIDTQNWLREQGYHAERLPRTGRNDQGDIAVTTPETIYIIECKAPGPSNRIDLAGWMREAQTEANNYAKARNLNTNNVTPIVLIKARGKPIEQAYYITPFEVNFPERATPENTR